MTPKPVEPISHIHGTIPVFVPSLGRCVPQEGMRPIYPPSPMGRRLRSLRVARGWSVGQAASHHGISVPEWDGLERGSHTLSAAEWLAVLNELEGAVAS